MLKWFAARASNTRKAKQLYGAVVAAARQSEFYRDYGVPDTLNGRYEMIVLTLFQVLERLRAEGELAKETSRLTLEAFFTDMDDCMREIGVGDLSVPKKVKKAAAGFYERTKAYRAALDADDREAMAAALDLFIAGEGVIGVQDKVGDRPPASASHPPQSKPDAPTQVRIKSALLAAHAFRQREALCAADGEAVIAGLAFTTPLPA